MIRLMTALVLSSTVALAAEVEPRVAVVFYQGVGTDPGVVERLAAALRTEVATRKWNVISADESDRKERAAAMCGEDVECLSTVGQRLQGRYVVAFGVGRVGKELMVSAMLIDTDSSKRLAEFSERFAAMPTDAAPLATRIVDTLFVGMKPPVKLVPVEVVPPPVVIVPPAPSHKLRPAAIGTAIGAGVLAIGGGVLTGAAASNFSTLPDVAPNERSSAVDAQRGLNLAADVTMATAGVAAVVAVVLFIVDGSAP